MKSDSEEALLKKTDKAIRRFAAEHKYLQKLWDDLEEISKDGTISMQLRSYRKARRALKYVNRAEPVAEKFLEPVMEEVRINPLFVNLAAEIDVPKNKLLRAFSFYDGQFRKELQEVVSILGLKKRYMLQRDPRKVETTERNLQIKLALIEEQVGVLLTWSKALQAALQQLEDREQEAIRQRRRKFLQKGVTMVGGRVGYEALGKAAAVAGGLKTGLDYLFPKEAQATPRLSEKDAKRAQRPSTKLIVLHHTESGDQSALASIYKDGTANYIVTTDGTVYAPINHSKIAKHAGRSMWDGLREISNYSVGIEIVGYHYKEMTSEQYRAVRELLVQLKKIYGISDNRILPHAAVSYNTPNRYNKKNYRPRRWCGMLMATPAVRTKLGVGAMPKTDPDIDARRLVLVSNSEEQQRFYTYFYPAYKSKIPQPPVKVLPEEPEKSVEEDVVSFKEIGVDGDTAWSIAQEEYRSKYTIYIFPTGVIRTGNELPDITLGLDINQLPKGTKVLVGYAYGGRIRPGRSAYSICKEKWNYPSTFYRLPNKTIVSGDQLDSDSIPAESIILFRM